MKMPAAAPRFSGTKMSATTAFPLVRKPVTAHPWSARNTSSTAMVGANMQTMVAARKVLEHSQYVLRRPKRSAGTGLVSATRAQPVDRCAAARPCF
jgi:hypothetical protein